MVMLFKVLQRYALFPEPPNFYSINFSRNLLRLQYFNIRLDYLGYLVTKTDHFLHA